MNLFLVAIRLHSGECFKYLNIFPDKPLFFADETQKAVLIIDCEIHNYLIIKQLKNLTFSIKMKNLLYKIVGAYR